MPRRGVDLSRSQLFSFFGDEGELRVDERARFPVHNSPSFLAAVRRNSCPSRSGCELQPELT